MVIETAIVAPVLVLLSLGAFQVSTIIARQSELQSAAAEAAAIALAAAPDTFARRVTVKGVIQASTGLAADKVIVSEVFRCDSQTGYVSNANSCNSGNVRSRFIRVQLLDTYTPTWTRFGVGSAINFNEVRNVMYKQEQAN
ncbi:TadE/TadG family type IV pilus assembly protein [Novosphingobium sp.]|uniref:TadE/TadG family type IV pilus assembly protein n=2 Tax=unclassified Novosphingobium TaxID=2644732 RepID=UPI002D1FAB4B|nr:TadE/TadG family type IV pilus assembly protein [Novosphingobium sp.]